MDRAVADPLMRKVAWRLIPFLCLLYIFNIIDRANVTDDKYADSVGTTFVSTIYHGKATYEAAKGPLPTRFICMHGGGGRGAVFVYTLPAS